MIGQWLQQKIQESATPYCLLVSPLLLETSQVKLVNRILVIDVEVETQVSRTLDRDGGNEATVRAIIASQIDRQARLARADDVLSNEVPPSSLRSRVMELHNQYLEMAQAKSNDE